MNYREVLIHNPQKVIKALKKNILKDSAEYESLVHIDSQQNSLQLEKRNGTLSYEELRIEQNKINARILDVIKAFESNSSHNPISLDNYKVYKKNKYLKAIAGVFSLGLLLVVISVIFISMGCPFYLYLSPIVFGITLLIYFYQEVIVLFTNNYALIYRRKKYYENKKKYPDKTIVLSEGDSWFCYPFVKDVTDYLSNYYNVFSLAEASDEAQKILRDGDLFAFAELENPDIVLLSAGGNEISIKFRDKILFQDYKGGAFFSAYLETVLNEIVLFYYEQAIRDLQELEVNIIIHGYDYPRKYDKSIFNFGGSLYHAIKKRGYPNPTEVIKELIDLFNERISALADKYPNVHYLDLRNTLKSKEEWLNEAHPNNDGFLRIATKFKNKIEEILAKEDI